MPTDYSSSHQSSKGPGDARPAAQQIITDQGLENKLSNQTILITGVSSGLGIETARALYSTGAKIYITVRDLQKGQAVAKDLSTDPSRPIEILELDLGSFASIKKCASSFLAKSKTLNTLICNAGVMACPEGKTEDGFEMQFGTNYLGHFLLFQLLKDAMLAAAKPGAASRVVTLSSCGHRISGVLFDNYNFQNPVGSYNQWVSYGQSKTAMIYLTNEIDRLYGSQGIHGLACHPGVIATSLSRHIADDPMAKQLNEDPRTGNVMKNVEQGAATTVWAAVAKEFEGRGGLYLEDVHVSEPASKDPWIYDPGYAPHAYDQKAEKQFWNDSLKMVGMA